MGISKIFDLIKKKCPEAIKQRTASDFKGKIIAIDSSMVLLQLIFATQTINKKYNKLTEIKDFDGNLTSHLMGILQRSVFFEKNGIKACWVFDGQPPEEKLKLLKKRNEIKNSSKIKKETSLEKGDLKKIQKFSKRSINITPQIRSDTEKLVKLLGLPYIKAPQEGEAQCAALARDGLAYGVATEDMDCLTFGTPFMLRNFNIKNEIIEIQLHTILENFKLTMEQYVDLCILCGCDYCGTIPSIGPTTAYNLIKKYKNIEGVLEYIHNSENLDKYNYDPEDFKYQTPREIFTNPPALNSGKVKLKWEKPNIAGIKDFLCSEKRFSAIRVEKLLNKFNF